MTVYKIPGLIRIYLFGFQHSLNWDVTNVHMFPIFHTWPCYIDTLSFPLHTYESKMAFVKADCDVNHLWPCCTDTILYQGYMCFNMLSKRASSVHAIMQKTCQHNMFGCLCKNKSASYSACFIFREVARYGPHTAMFELSLLPHLLEMLLGSNSMINSHIFF